MRDTPKAFQGKLLHKRDPPGLQCAASVLGLPSRTRSSASLPLNFFDSFRRTCLSNSLFLQASRQRFKIATTLVVLDYPGLQANAGSPENVR